MENGRNLIQRVAEFRGWKTADLWRGEILGIVIEGCI